MRPRYLKICPRCVELGVPARHFVGSPRAGGCEEHQHYLRNRTWSRKNKKARRRQNQRYKHRHGDTIRKGCRARYQRRREEALRWQREYYREHRAEQAAKQRERNRRPKLTPGDDAIRREISSLALI